MIKISNLTFTYPGADSTSLNNITLEIEKGDFIAIIGNNGCGKSTLCKTLNGLIPHFYSGDFEGKVEICSLDTQEHDIGDLAQKIGYVYQDFENQIVRPTVIDDASFACLNYAMVDYLEKGREALRMTGLSKKENDYVWQLSGGQKHLLALAGITALKPEIFVLDEPIAQLDPKHARQIYDILKYFNDEHGKTIIVIEHHTEFIAEYCRNVVMMKDGDVLWKMPAKEALNRVDELQSCNIFPPQITIAAKHLKDIGIICSDEIEMLPTTLKEGIEYFRGLEHTEKRKLVKHKNQTSDPIVQFRNVSVEYRAVKGVNPQILSDFSLDIYKGEKIALIGTNGAGKSTIMKLMTGLLKPKSGDIFLYGTSLGDVSPEEMSQKISFVYQNSEEMFIKDSIRGDIEYAMKVREIPDYDKRTEELLKIFSLKELEHRDGRLLSGGQMRRASLAIGIALNPSILLLDEPTANLDIATRKEIIKTLYMLKNVVQTTVIATHDMQLVSEWADRIIVLDSGYIIADGTREEIFNNRFVIENAGIRPPEIYNMGKLLNSAAECFNVQEFLDSFSYVKETVYAEIN